MEEGGDLSYTLSGTESRVASGPEPSRVTWPPEPGPAPGGWDSATAISSVSALSRGVAASWGRQVLVSPGTQGVPRGPY